jgi:hypothetical protein
MKAGFDYFVRPHIKEDDLELNVGMFLEKPIQIFGDVHFV